MGAIREKKIFNRYFWGCLLIAMTLLTYIPAMDFGFNWDDELNVISHDLSTNDGLKKIWLDPRTRYQYYPANFTVFWLEYQLWQDNATGYHFISILLHALSAVILWRLLTYLGAGGAWMAAAVFALHPVHVESVAWIAERKNVLSAFFCLLSMFLYIRLVFKNNDSRNVQNSNDSHHLLSDTNSRNAVIYFLALILFACALLSKIVTCSMPIIILLIFWWKKGRIVSNDVRALYPFFLLAVIFGLITLWMEKFNVGAIGSAYEFNIIERCIIAGRAFWFYIHKLLWPYNIIFIYPQWEIDAGVWWQYIYLILAAAFLALLWLVKNWAGKAPLTAVSIFVITLLPTLGFLDVYFMRYSFVADHFQYMASISLIALIIGCGNSLFNKAGPKGKYIKISLCIVLIGILGTLSWREEYKFKDAKTLWLDTVTKNPECHMAHNNLGVVYYKMDRINDAFHQFSLAIQINPDLALAHNNIGLVLSKKGQINEAIEHHKKAIDLDPKFFQAYFDLGLLLARQDKNYESVKYYIKALTLRPHNIEVRFRLGNALFFINRLDDAIKQYAKILEYRPDYAEVHYNLGAALLQKGKEQEAMIHFQKASQIKPGLKDVTIDLNPDTD